MTSEDVNFVDLACILKITSGTVLEKFGGVINSSFFDAVNLAGTLKQKGLVDFSSNYPGPNEIVLTDAARSLIAEANAKGGAASDKLDEGILNQLSGGKRMPVELGAALNLRPKDLALRIYKLYKQGYLLYELKSGNVELMLTESGFLKASAATNANLLPGQQQTGAQQGAAQAGAQMQPQLADQDQQIIDNIQSQRRKKRANKRLIVVLLAILAIVMIYALYYRGYI